MAAAGLGYAVFGPRRARAVPPGRVVLDYWEKWTGQEAQAMRRVVDAFNASQDRIWVRYFSMGAVDQKAMIAIAGGDPPDVVGLWNFSSPAFSEADAILPLDEMIGVWGDEVSADFERLYGDIGFRIEASYYAGPIWGQMHYKGRLWGVPNTCSSMGLVYSRAAFREVGLDPDDPPKTIAEMDEAAELLTTRRADGSIERIGFIQRDPGWWNWIWGYFFGGSIYDVKTNRATAYTPENIRGYDWVRSYPVKYGMSRLVSFQSGFGNYNSTQQPLLAGKMAMAFHGPFLVNVVNTFDPDFDYGSAPFPVSEDVYNPDEPIALLESDMLFIPKGCKHPREAFEFVCFTQRRAMVELLAIAHCKPSPLAAVSDGFYARHPHRYIEVFNKMVRSPRAFPKPQTPVWPQYEDEFNAAIHAFWTELDVPPAEILAGIQKRGQQAIDQHAAQRARRGET